MGGRERNVDPLAPVFSAVFILLLAFTAALVVLSFPAGFYYYFGPGSAPNPFGSVVHPYLILGLYEVVLPFGVSGGALFIVLSLVYMGLFAHLLLRPRSPQEAAFTSLKEGVGALVTSPFFLSIVSFSFLVFTSAMIDILVPVIAPPTTLLGLTYAPLAEEVGFRVLLIGALAAVLSLGLPWKEILGVLWRPSSAYSGSRVNGPVRAVVIGWLVVSSVAFGFAHVLSGWPSGKIFEATYGGLVLGYLYIRYGFAFLVIAHWGVDYFGSVFAFFGQTAFGAPPSAQPEFFLQAAVDLDMQQLIGFASFLLVAYLGLKRLQRRSTTSEVHKDAVEGSVFGI